MVVSRLWTHVDSPSTLPSQPFADPNAKKKYTEIAFGAHALTTARSLLGSTLFGIALTCGLHYYKGMIMGLAIQAAMAPFNLVENALVKAIFLGNGLKVDGKIFDEKEASELSPDDEVVDQSGQPVVRVGRKIEEKPLEEVLLDTWDAGAKADVSAIMSVMTKKNCNFQTKDDRWTALMILAGLGAKGTASAMRQLIELGANPAIADKEGWNALHWAAFHNSPDGARELRREAKLLSVPDKDGLTPLETAKKEKNDDVAKIIEEALGESKKSK